MIYEDQMRACARAVDMTSEELADAASWALTHPGSTVYGSAAETEVGRQEQPER